MTVSISTAAAGQYQGATDEVLERLVMNMTTENDFVILERDDKPDGFAQAALARTPDAQHIAGQYIVEYRDGPDSQWQAKTTDRDKIYESLAGWAFDRPGWKDGLSWERLELGF